MLGVAAAAGLTGKTRAGPDTNQGMETSLGGGLTATLPAVDPRMDPESRAWVAALSGEGGDREAALARLHELLLRAARFELSRRRGQLAGLSAAERHDLAVQAADDAMMSVLARLADFRGLSRFSTWAYKFALLEAATKARRLAWRDRELPRPPEDWAALADPGGRPEAAAEHAELLAALRAAVAEVLTPTSGRCCWRWSPAGCRSTCWPSAAAPPGARSTRQSTTPGASCAPTWPSPGCWPARLGRP